MCVFTHVCICVCENVRTFHARILFTVTKTLCRHSSNFTSNSDDIIIPYRVIDTVPAACITLLYWKATQPVSWVSGVQVCFRACEGTQLVSGSGVTASSGSDTFIGENIGYVCRWHCDSRVKTKIVATDNSHVYPVVHWVWPHCAKLISFCVIINVYWRGSGASM